MIDRGCAVGPRVTAVLRDVHDHSVLGAHWPRETNPVKRQVSVIRDTVVTKSEHVVALHKVSWIGRGHSFPRLAAVERDVVITAGAWLGWMAGLERRGDHVVGISRIDRDRDFSRIDGVGFSDAHNLLCGSKRGDEKNDANAKTDFHMFFAMVRGTSLAKLKVINKIQKLLTQRTDIDL